MELYGVVWRVVTFLYQRFFFCHSDVLSHRWCLHVEYRLTHVRIDRSRDSREISLTFRLSERLVSIVADL